jgi:hypothetical protein
MEAISIAYELSVGCKVVILTPLCVSCAVIASYADNRFSPRVHVIGLCMSALLVGILFHALANSDGASLSGSNRNAFYIMASPLLLLVKAAINLLPARAPADTLIETEEADCLP